MSDINEVHVPAGNAEPAEVTASCNELTTHDPKIPPYRRGYATEAAINAARDAGWLQVCLCAGDNYTWCRIPTDEFPATHKYVEAGGYRSFAGWTRI